MLRFGAVRAAAIIVRCLPRNSATTAVTASISGMVDRSRQFGEPCALTESQCALFARWLRNCRLQSYLRSGFLTISCNPSISMLLSATPRNLKVCVLFRAGGLSSFRAICARSLGSFARLSCYLPLPMIILKPCECFLCHAKSDSSGLW
jgi:hypothetical protein